MEMSAAGRALLRDLEGCKALPYRDSAGLLSLGVGHLLTKSELASGKILLPTFGRCRYGDHPWPDMWIDALLRQDLRRVEEALARNVTVPLSQGQYDVLCSWIFNVGVEAFRTSTLRKRLNAGLYAEVPAQLRRWVYAGGHVVAGLRTRREREAAAWEEP